MTNKDKAKLLRSAASALEHGRISTAHKKLALANKELIDAAQDALDVLSYTLTDCAEDDRSRMEPAANGLQSALGGYK